MRKTVKAVLGAVLGAALVMGAAQATFAQGMEKSGKMGKKSAEKTLYQRLGGKKAITAVVEQFVTNVGGDARINKFFAHTDLAHLKMELVEQICKAAGGPCKYTGKSMKAAHQGMGVSSADFNALVEDLVKALDQFKVGEREKSELLGALGSMKGDIVEKP